MDVAAGALDGLTMASRLEALRLVTGPGREFTDDERIKSAIDKERAARRSSPGRAQDYWEWLVVAEQLLAVKSQASSARRVAVPASASKTRPGLPHVPGTPSDVRLERR